MLQNNLLVQIWQPEFIVFRLCTADLGVFTCLKSLCLNTHAVFHSDSDLIRNSRIFFSFPLYIYTKWTKTINIYETTEYSWISPVGSRSINIMKYCQWSCSHAPWAFAQIINVLRRAVFLYITDDEKMSSVSVVSINEWFKNCFLFFFFYYFKIVMFLKQYLGYW